MSDKGKINDTHKPDSGSVLGSTLDGMEQWDMNVVNDVGGSHGFNNPGSNKGKK
jgi:hypothetical protein